MSFGWVFRPVTILFTLAVACSCGSASSDLGGASTSVPASVDSKAADTSVAFEASTASEASVPFEASTASDPPTTAALPATAVLSTAALPTAASPSAPTALSSRTTAPSSTTTAPPRTIGQPTGDAVTSAGPDDPAAKVRAAARATAAEPRLAVTVLVVTQKPVTLVYRDGAPVDDCSSPSGAPYAVPALLSDLQATTGALVLGNGGFDPTGASSSVSAFTEVRLDEQGRLARASWYGGELSTTYTFAYNSDASVAGNCSTTVPRS